MYAPCVMIITHGVISASSFTALRAERSSPVTRAVSTATYGVVSVDVLSIPFGSAPVFSFSSRAVIHVVFDMTVVEHDVIFIFAHCAEYRTSTMPSTSFIAVSTLSFIMLPVHNLSTSSVFASAFSQFCSCCCCVLLFAAGFFVAAVFSLLFFDDILVSCLRAQASQLQCFFLFGRFLHALSCRVFL